MSFVGLQDAIVASIGTELASVFNAVQEHGGRFDEEEIRRIATKQPACLVSLMGGETELQGGVEGWCKADIVAAIVTAGTSSNVRLRAAATLAESVTHLVAINQWAYENAKRPERIVSRNSYSGVLDRLGVAMWIVSWQQLVKVSTYDLDDLDDLYRIVSQIDFAPADGVIDDEQHIWLQGTLMSAYGQIYVSTPAATAIAVADTFQKALGTTTLLRADGMDMPITNRIRHTDAVTRPVNVQLSASVSVDSDAEVSIAIAKNGVVVDESAITEDIASADGAEAMVANALVELDEDDYVEAWVTADSTVSVTFEKMTLVAVAT